MCFVVSLRTHTRQWNVASLSRSYWHWSYCNRWHCVAVWKGFIISLHTLWCVQYYMFYLHYYIIVSSHNGVQMTEQRTCTQVQLLQSADCTDNVSIGVAVDVMSLSLHVSQCQQCPLSANVYRLCSGFVKRQIYTSVRKWWLEVFRLINFVMISKCHWFVHSSHTASNCSALIVTWWCEPRPTDGRPPCRGSGVYGIWGSCILGIQRWRRLLRVRSLAHRTGFMRVLKAPGPRSEGVFTGCSGSTSSVLASILRRWHHSFWS